MELVVFATLLFVFYLLVFSSFFTTQEVKISKNFQTTEFCIQDTKAPENKYDTSLLQSMEELVKIIAESEYAQKLIEQDKSQSIASEVNVENSKVLVEEELPTTDIADVVMKSISTPKGQDQETISTVEKKVTSQNLPLQTELPEAEATENTLISEKHDGDIKPDSQFSEVDENFINYIDENEEKEEQLIAKETIQVAPKKEANVIEEDSRPTETIAEEVESHESLEAHTEILTPHDQETTEESNPVTHGTRIKDKTSAEVVQMFKDMPSPKEVVHGIKDEAINNLKVKQLHKLANHVGVQKSVKGKRLTQILHLKKWM